MFRHCLREVVGGERSRELSCEVDMVISEGAFLGYFLTNRVMMGS